MVHIAKNRDLVNNFAFSFVYVLQVLLEYHFDSSCSSSLLVHAKSHVSIGSLADDLSYDVIILNVLLGVFADEVLHLDVELGHLIIDFLKHLSLPALLYSLLRLISAVFRHIRMAGVGGIKLALLGTRSNVKKIIGVATTT